MTSNSIYTDFVEAIRPVFGLGEARSLARIIREDVFGHQDLDTLSFAQAKKLKVIENQLVKGIPLQYILGVADFYGLKLAVDSSVLIPRQETESLVYEVIRFAQANQSGRRIKILDIGTGSGCIALALKKEIDWADILAVDVSIPALNVARKNNQALGFCTRFEQFDVRDEKAWHRMGTYDIVVSNPPYIPPSERSQMPDYVLNNEPELALFVPEEDAYLFYRKIGEFALGHLAENGLLAFEVNEFRAQATADVIKGLGYQVELKNDLSGAPRVLLAYVSQK